MPSTSDLNDPPAFVTGDRWARLWFGATAACVAAGVLISVFTAAHNSGGHFRTPVERAFNTFVFFTVQSNLIVGVTTLLLAQNPRRSSPVFATFRLIGIVAITVTGIVYHVALAGLFDLQGWDQLGNQLVHTAVPILAVVGWLMFGPRGLTSARVVCWSLAFPVCWLAFTLIRGAFVHWYPYPFIDVTRLGYGGTLLNCLWVSLLLLALAGAANAVDRRLSPRPSARAPSGFPSA
ncbi:MAG: Pr6Pr family membrane protein [Acidimicrobiales bacterium]